MIELTTRSKSTVVVLLVVNHLHHLQEESDALLEEFLSIQCRLYDDLALAYRVLDMPPHELGAPACRKFDIEAALPGREGLDYGEISSCSNCTDFQARRLNCRDEEDDSFVHTVNGTAVAVPRLIMALCEQGQLQSGAVAVPGPLQKHLRWAEVLRQLHKKRRLQLTYVQSPKFFTDKFRKALNEKEQSKVQEKKAEELSEMKSDSSS